ncbi:SecA DEAD-like domain [Nesidiocoris tenuis]|uniref:SecA DEAD-like domain n=1 Tax=Nesidiocoris tenuis TaxID=355587 RepID=A0ABN7B7M3_9HEMI|nr:SecA DEAD-like domain [Nesidiocoris tenuis]
MKRRAAQDIKKENEAINTKVQESLASDTDVGNKLLTNCELSLANIEDLGRQYAEKHAYDKKQFVVCGIAELSGRLESCKNGDLENRPIFVIFQNDNNGKSVFCLLNQAGKTVCLFVDFIGEPIPKNVSSILESHFGTDIDYKIHAASGKKPDPTTVCILSVKMLETMMRNLNTDKRDDFVRNFDSHKSYKFLGWLKKEVVHLKDELFALVKDGYYKTVASDVDQLSTDVEFKVAIKSFIDSIPLVEEVDSFVEYQSLLKKFVDIDENDVDFESPAMRTLNEQIASARNKAFSKVENLKIECQNVGGNPELDVVKRFPAQMKKFTGIFEPLARSEVDETLQRTLEEICAKLDLDPEKLKSFFKARGEEKPDEDRGRPDVRNIGEVVELLPELRPKDAALEKQNKSLEEIMSELKVDESETTVGSLGKSYRRAKEIHASWKNEDAAAVNRWAKLKNGRLSDSEIPEAIAVLDRANELVTGGHRLRDTQILSALTFLQQKNKGQLSQIHTGEGKTTIVSLIAAIRALQGKKVDVVTSNPVLAADGVKDKKLFYDLLGLSVSTNNLDEKYRSGDRECYKCDIVYGSIGNFQFDYLKDSFLNLNTRGGRQFDCIVLDEVDSMIIDNATHIAKLSEPLPGMDSLKYVYIKIWQELHKAEKEIVEEFQSELKSKAEELKNLLDRLGEEKVQRMYERFVAGLEDSLFDRIKDRIKSTDPANIDLIPSHIHEYATRSLDRWINSAIDAKYKYQEDEQYVVREKNGENVIQPVDYANTGITLKNTIWQYGLHQFLQLKHNLHLTAESLTSCFISNLGYINKFGGTIFGLTGTLGSDAEQKLLSSVYNVGYAKIPTYRAKNFREIDGRVVSDGMFADAIAEETISLLDQGRSSLIICETIREAKNVKKALETKNEGLSVETFFDEDNAHITEAEIGPGQVVIATNIAGRGTDFKTTASLENNGGLHVCVAFLPCNKRVEDQAFGRTARQGNNGSAGLVVKRSEIEKLGIDSDDFEVIKRERDQKEMERIEMIKSVKVPELKFQDELFEMFSAQFRRLGEEGVGRGEHKYVLDDLKEYWAFWLEKNNFKGEDLAGKSVDTEFGRFTSEASKAIGGEIVFNPFYSVQQAEYFISNGNLDEAEKSLNHAIDISKNPEILHSAYLKLFEIAIERGHVFIDKCRKAVGDVFLISAAEPDRKYKENAVRYLKLAQKAFKKELDYMERMFGNKDFSSIIRADDTAENENLFLKHIMSKQRILHLNIHHAESLVEQIEKHQAGLTIGGRIPDYLANLKPKNDSEKLLKDSITVSELSELAAVGSNTTYALREVHDVCPDIARAAQIQIGGGIALLVSGMCFPPAMPVTSAIGGTMITEGITDIAIELINRNSDGKFDKGAYIKGKVISYGISLLTMGINAALQCPKILEKAKKACRWLSNTLRKCPVFKGACEFLATKIDKLADWFEKMETIAKFNRLSKAEKLKFVEDLEKSGSDGFKQLQNLGSELSQIEQLRELERLGQLGEMTHLEKCVSTLQQVAISTAFGVTQKVATNQIMSKVINPALSKMMSGLKPKIKEHVSLSVRANIDEDKWRRASAEDIKNAIAEIKNSIGFETIKNIFRDAVIGISKYCNNWQVQLGALAIDQFVSWKEVIDYARDLCLKINAKLRPTGDGVGEHFEELLNRFIDQLSEEMYALAISTTVKSATDFYSVGKSAYGNYKAAKREEAKCMEIHKEFENGGQAGLEQAAAAADAEKICIHIYDEDGNLTIVGEQYTGEPVKLNYYPPDENHPTGHYVPFGKDKNFTSGSAGENNCFFDAVGHQTEKDPATLRDRASEQIKSDPTRYIASNLREYLPDSNIDGIRMAGGARRFRVADDDKRYTETSDMGIEEAMTKHYADGTNDYFELLTTTAKLKLENPEAKISATEASTVQIGRGKRAKNSSAADDFTDGRKTVKDFAATDASHTVGFTVDVELPDMRSADAEKDAGRMRHTTARTNIMPHSINNNSAFDKGRDKIGFELYKEFVNKGAKPSDIQYYQDLYVTRMTEHLRTDASNRGATDFLKDAASKGVKDAWDKNNEVIDFF